VAENGTYFIFDAVEQADLRKYVRCPSAYRIGAQMLAHITLFFPLKSTNFHRMIFLLLKFS
jgi:hypothetical protein